MTGRIVALMVVVSVGVIGARQEKDRGMSDVRLMTVDPGHFHAALVQKEMYPGVARARGRLCARGSGSLRNI